MKTHHAINARGRGAAVRRPRRNFSAWTADAALVGVTLDALEAIVIVLDTRGRVMWLNRAGIRATGYGPDELVGRVVWDVLIPAEEVGAVKAVFRGLRDGRALPPQGETHENDWITRDGARLRIRWSNSTVRDAAGRCRYVVGTGIDVSGRHRAERELRDSESLFRALFEQAAVGIAQIGLDGRWLRFNDAMCRILGYRRSELALKTFQEITHPDDLEPDAEQARRLRDGEIQTYSLEKRYLRPDGSTVWAHLTGSAVRDESGAARYFVAVIKDVSARVEAVRALCDSEARSRALFEAAPDAVVTIDAAGTVESVNPAAVRMFGYPAVEIVGRNVSRLMPEPFRGEHDASLRRLLETGVPRIIGRSREVVALRKDGSTFFCDLSVGEVRLGDRRLFTGILRDATERKRAEALRVARDAAEAANRAKDELLAVVAHDLRAPLASIRLWTEVLKRSGDQQAVRRDAFTAIEAGVEAQRHLVDDLMDASHLGGGGLTIRPGPLDLGEVIRSAAETVRASADHRGLRLEVDTPGTPLRALADPVRLRQVLGNLLSNAIKFTPAGGTVRVSVRRAGAAALVRVEDTGRGIPREALDRVFDRYWQGEPGGGNGLGLGLAIVRHLVELHGGTVRAESEGPGRGAAFSFTIPLRGPRAGTQ